MLVSFGCAGKDMVSPVIPSHGESAPPISITINATSQGQFLNWGIYDLEIASDGSYFKVFPNRTANAVWGYHLNAVKLLEKSPCTNCINLSNIHILPNGDL